MDKLDLIINKLTDMASDIARIGSHVETNTKDLEEHIRRTNLLEDKLHKSEDRIDSKLEEALMPVRWGKVSAKLAGVVGVLVALWEIYTRMKV
jgi:hypothetical protein